jgi:aromatic-L-amino-acid decarboxylase
MTDQLSIGTVRAATADDAAETGRVDEALQRLIPALRRFSDAQVRNGVPAYRPGTVPSELAGLPVDGAGIDAMIDELSTAVEHGCRITSPGFSGWITTGATTAGVVAQTATTHAGVQRYVLHAFNALESTGLRWLAELCGLPQGVEGVFTSGGSTANLLALGAARQAAFERMGVDVAQDGVPFTTRGRIYASARAHRTIHRAAAVLGLGRNGVREIATDPDGRIDVAALEAALQEDAAEGIVPIATVAVAGNTDLGAVDPIADVVAAARRYGSWVHVDGAYGLIANTVDAMAPLFAGVEEADSWIVDPHKWLATGVGVGATYVRDGAVLTRAFAEGHAAYLEGSFTAVDQAQSQFDVMGGSWADQSVELSSPPRGVLVWAVLREIGRSGVRDRVVRHVGFAQDLARRVRDHDRLELLCGPHLSVVCFRYQPRRGGIDVDALNTGILERLRRETPFIPSSTVVGGAVAIRPCYINPRTTQLEVDGLADAVVRLGDELTG